MSAGTLFVGAAMVGGAWALSSLAGDNETAKWAFWSVFMVLMWLGIAAQRKGG